MSRSAFLLLPLLAPLALGAQDLPSRVGFGVALVMPQGDIQSKVGQGHALSVNIHFNREATHEGRLRIEESTLGSKTVSEPDPYGGLQRVTRTGHGLAVGYDWMPGNPQVRAILGLGGMFWYQEAKVVESYGYAYRDDAVGFAVVPTFGLQVRFNRNVGLELRYAPARNDVASDKKSLNTTMDHATVGLEFRW